MPSEPIADLSRLDLTQTIADHAAVYRVIKQTGKFALLDAVVHFDPEVALCVGRKEIRSDAWWAADHIPGRPLFPGALMIETGAQLCSWDFMKRSECTAETFVGFGGLNDTRFRGMVEPGVTMYFVARPKRIRKTMFTYEVQGLVEQSLVFETEVMGVIL